MGLGMKLPLLLALGFVMLGSETHANNVGTCGAGKSGTSQGEPPHQISFP